MSQLENNFSVISGACESVNNSFSARRSQLEKLNGVKKNLTKLQFLMDLPGRLQRCVDEGQPELAVRTYGKARKMLNAVGHVASFEGIRTEADLIMRRLTQSLSARLEEDSQLPADLLGSTVWLLLQLDGNEEALIKEYLTRRRRTIQEELTNFSALKAVPEAVPEAAEASEEPSDVSAAPTLTDNTLSAPASFVKQLGLRIVPELVQMHEAWHSLFLEPSPADGAEEQLSTPDAEGTTEEGKIGAVSRERKELMLLEALKELFAALVEICRRRLSEEDAEPLYLLQALRELMIVLDPVDTLMPQANVLGRANQIAEGLAQRAVDTQLDILQNRLGCVVKQLAAPTDDGAANSEQLQEQLQGAAATVVACVQDALHDSAPLIVPLCELLNLRADGMAKHLIAGLHSSLHDVARTALEPAPHVRGVLLCAGLCLHMASSGVSQVPAMLKELFAPHGLGGAALSFDTASMLNEMALAADQLLQRFVGMQVRLMKRPSLPLLTATPCRLAVRHDCCPLLLHRHSTFPSPSPNGCNGWTGCRAPHHAGSPRWSDHSCMSCGACSCSPPRSSVVSR